MQDINEEKDKKFEEKLRIGEMNDERKEILKELLKKYKNLFEYDKEKLGKIKVAKHEIIIEEGQKPISQRRYKETEEKCRFIKKEVEQLLKMGKIRESKSPWASPVVLAKKKDADYRFCIDYRKLNKITKGDSYLTPR